MQDATWSGKSLFVFYGTIKRKILSGPVSRRGYTTWDHVEVESKQTASYCPYCGSHIPSKYG